MLRKLIQACCLWKDPVLIRVEICFTSFSFPKNACACKNGIHSI